MLEGRGDGSMQLEAQSIGGTAKLPVKILFPLILFIFPTVFVIVLGPAAAQIGEAFK